MSKTGRQIMWWRGYIIRTGIWLYSGKYIRDQIGSEERIQMTETQTSEPGEEHPV